MTASRSLLSFHLILYRDGKDLHSIGFSNPYAPSQVAAVYHNEHSLLTKLLQIPINPAAIRLRLSSSDFLQEP
jgi:hypothetical protein